jgi:hypothetical protein
MNMITVGVIPKLCHKLFWIEAFGFGDGVNPFCWDDSAFFLIELEAAAGGCGGAGESVAGVVFSTILALRARSRCD